jgi:hypothetical protein
MSSIGWMAYLDEGHVTYREALELLRFPYPSSLTTLLMRHRQDFISYFTFPISTKQSLSTWKPWSCSHLSLNRSNKLPSPMNRIWLRSTGYRLKLNHQALVQGDTLNCFTNRAINTCTRLRRLMVSYKLISLCGPTYQHVQVIWSSYLTLRTSMHAISFHGRSYQNLTKLCHWFVPHQGSYGNFSGGKHPLQFTWDVTCTWPVHHNLSSKIQLKRVQVRVQVPKLAQAQVDK